MSDSNEAQETPKAEPAAPADPQAPAENADSPTSSDDTARAATDSNEQSPKKRRRRRRGRKKKSGDPATQGQSSAGEAPAPAPAATLDPGIAALAGGLLSHIDERQVPCSNDGCKNTWTWTAAEQVAAYGQSPPRRECAKCAATSASEVRCCVEGCRRTWTWTREAQIKHRSWTKRRGDERSGGRKRRRRGDGAPRRKCELCQAKLAKLSERPSVCKVHGCTRPVTVDRDAQLRAWAASGSTDLESEAPMAKQMCSVCREFCRTHDDREVLCGRPGCEKTWTYKRGAQLQAFLAGRFEDPIRLCESCESETRKAGHAAGAPANVELMPCIVPGCEGVWHYRVGQKLTPCQEGEQPTERMCDQHREAAGEQARGDSTPDDEPASLADASPETSPESVREITTSPETIS